MEALVVLATCVEVGSLVCSIVKSGNEFYKKVKPLLRMLPVVGDALRMFDSDSVALSDEERSDILDRIASLQEYTNDVARDINEKIEWQTMKIQYSPAIERIKLGMEYLLGGYSRESNKADEKEGQKHKRQIFKDKLELLCGNEKMALSVRALISGLRGGSRIGDNEFADDIFQIFYKQCVGNRPQMVGLAERMMQLLANGMLIVVTVDSLKYGQNGGKTAAESYEADWERCCENVKGAIDRCTNNVKENIEADVREALKKGEGPKTNPSSLSDRLSEKFEEKYDWLEHFICIYLTKDPIGPKYLCHAGDAVICEVNNMCGVVFYREKDERPQFSSETMNTLDIIRADREQNNPQKALENIRNTLDARKIGWWGLLCVHDRFRPVGGSYRLRCSFARDFGTHLNKFVLLK